MNKIRRFVYSLASAIRAHLPDRNELLLILGIALTTRGLFFLWAPLVWIWPGAWLMFWGLGLMLPPKGGGR